MDEPRDPRRFASDLLRQDEPLNGAQYEEYRMNLEKALTAAESREVVTGRVVAASCVLSLALLFVGWSNAIGSFDPWSKDATPWSVAAGVLYWLATALFFLSLASYYSRFRPGTRAARERIRDAAILDLQRQLRDLRGQDGPATPDQGGPATG
jgi:hypothetical protein